MNPKSIFYKTLEHLFPNFRNVCIITNFFPPYPEKATKIAVGGVSEKYERFINELRYHKKKFHAISLYYQDISEKQDHPDVSRIGIYRPYRLFNSKYLFPLLEFFNPFFFLKTFKILVKQSPDLVVIGSTLQMSLSPILSAKCLRIEVVIQHDWLCPLYPKEGACGLIERLKNCGECLFRAFGSKQKKIVKHFFGIFSALILPIKRMIFNTCIIFVESRFYRDFYIKSGINPEKIYVVPPSPTVDNLTRHDQNFKRKLEKLLGNAKAIGYVGRLSPEKGIELLLESYKILKAKTKKDTKLVIAGDGPLRNLVINEAKNDPSILYLGWLSKDKLKCVYLLTDIILIPSLVRESFPHVALEAIRFERPIIGFGLGALKEILSSYPKGIMVDKVSSKKLAKAIQQEIVG